jgi:arsenate reductase (thioredoxin)
MNARVIFACVHNAGRSQMAAAFFNQLADPAQARAVSAGTQPADAIHPMVAAAMKEAGIDLANARPRLLTPELMKDATLLVTMGCGEQCPYIPGLEVDDWALPDPQGRPLSNVRSIRDDIRTRVSRLIQSRGWNRSSPSSLE